MAALPAARLQVFQPPFACTGVDYFGPIEVKLFRRSVKRWGCLFTCLTTRAVHLEMAYALDADSFICAYENFRVARGTPKFIHCDNGTNFKGGQSELAEALERLNHSIHNGTELHRPVVKLCLLEPELEDKECASETGRRAGDVPECKSEEASHPAAPQRHP
jgi:hypothetical protein